MFILLILALFDARETQLEPVKTFEEVDHEDFFMQNPFGAVFDKAGNLYVLDFAANVVFKWSEDGSFDRVIGKPGQGPGEFSFMNFGGPQGYMATHDGHLYVLDGAQKRILKFGPDGSYLDTVNVQLPIGRVAGFWMTNSGRYLLSMASFGKEEPTLEIVEVEADGQLKSLYQTPDESFRREGEGSRPTAIVLKPYGPGLFVRYDQPSDTLIYGNPVVPTIHLRSMEAGAQVRQVKVQTVPREVTQADIDEANEEPWIKNSRFFKLEFPERLSYFDDVMSLSGGRLFVFNISWHLRNIEGYVLNADGTPLHRVFFSCGEGGGLYQSRGKIVAIRADEELDYRVEQVTLK